MAKKTKVLRVEIFKTPEKIEPSAVTTAGNYILISHLVRPLTKLDRWAGIQGDLAESWFSSADRKTWNIKLKPSKFSNGEVIQASDVVASIERQMRLKTGVHFPFAEILSVKAKSSDSVEIVLKHSRKDFIFSLAKPEFGVLHKSDFSAEKNAGKFTITSGPYRLDRREGTKFYLKKNEYYRDDVQNNFDLVFDGSSSASPARLLNNEIDFFTTQQSLTLDEHKHLLAASSQVSAVKPHIGFSFWISVNPNSPMFKSQEARSAFQSFVKGYGSPVIDNFFWERAEQLYLPDGDGRPNAEELSAVWKKISQRAKLAQAQKSKLRVLPLKVDNELTKDVIKFLKSKFEVEVVKYSSEEELSKHIGAQNFDVKLSSNDFSSYDLSENLKTTFNASRPYVFVGSNKKYEQLLRKISEEEDRDKKSKLFKEIGLGLLDDGYIAPLAYLRLYFYLNRGVDISAWSNLFPEISMWKVKVNE